MNFNLHEERAARTLCRMLRKPWYESIDVKGGCVSLAKELNIASSGRGYSTLRNCISFFQVTARTVRFLQISYHGKMTKRRDLCVFLLLGIREFPVTGKFFAHQNIRYRTPLPNTGSCFRSWRSFAIARLTKKACFVSNILQFTSTMKSKISNRMNLLDFYQLVQLCKTDCHDDDWFLIDSKTFRTQQPCAIHVVIRRTWKNEKRKIGIEEYVDDTSTTWKKKRHVKGIRAVSRD